MREVAARIVLGASVALLAVLLAWGVWLLLTGDPDGGRHPVGALTAAVAVGLAALMAAGVRLRRRG